LLQRNSRGPQLYRRRRLAPQYAGLPAWRAGGSAQFGLCL